MWPTIRLRIQPVRQPKTNVINDCHVSAGRAVVSVPYESRGPVKVSKYYGRIFSRPVNFDIALYDQRIWHVIRAIYFNDSANSGNVALAEVKGIESDGSVFPVDWLQIGFAGTYRRTIYQSNCNEFGGPETLTVSEDPTPQVGAGEVRVQVRAAAINYWSAHCVFYAPPCPRTIHIFGCCSVIIAPCGPRLPRRKSMMLPLLTRLRGFDPSKCDFRADPHE
jgi:hypothetical protein